MFKPKIVICTLASAMMVVSVTSLAQDKLTDKPATAQTIKGLGLSKSQAANISIGIEGRTAVRSQLKRSGVLAADVEKQKYVCNASACFCYGDNDCNNMFTSNVCSSGSGSCTGEPPICTCSPD
ncbi:MAG: hypothetical protein ACR2O3_14330 [Rhizobiaceae bacterium]